MEFLKNPNYDFESKAKYFIALSIFFIGSGLAVMFTRGVNYGVEFSGGTQIIAQFQKTPEIDKVRRAVDRTTAGSVIQTYGDPTSNKVLIRIAGEATEGELDTGAKKVLQSLAENYPGNPVRWYEPSLSQSGSSLSAARAGALRFPSLRHRERPPGGIPCGASLADARPRRLPGPR